MGKKEQNLENHLLWWVYEPLKPPTPRLLLETTFQACTYSKDCIAGQNKDAEEVQNVDYLLEP